MHNKDIIMCMVPCACQYIVQLICFEYVACHLFKYSTSRAGPTTAFGPNAAGTVHIV